MRGHLYLNEGLRSVVGTVVGYEAIGVHLPGCLLAHLGKVKPQ